MSDMVVAIPTYNERQNLPGIVERTLAAVPDANVLVIDDNSPDGTGDLAEELSAADPRILVLHRTEKGGLGPAYRAGIEWAREHGYPYFAQMDADGSHHPEALPQLRAAIDEGADLAIGSRWVVGGKTEHWPLRRRLLSRGGSFYAGVALRIPIRDVTAGFRIYRLSAIADWDLSRIVSTGYCYQIEMSWQACLNGLRIIEVPITFTDRSTGKSKMSGGIVGEALFQVAKWGIQTWMGRARPVGRPSSSPDGS